MKLKEYNRKELASRKELNVTNRQRGAVSPVDEKILQNFKYAYPLN